MYADGLGLYLKVRDGNSKSWIFRYRTGGKLRDMGLGPFHTVSLAEARDKAEVCRAMRLKGLDPLGERLKKHQAKTIEAAEALTFEKCAETYIATHKDGWKNSKHADQWTTTLQTYVYPIFKDRPVAAIDDDLVLKVLQPIWKEKTETASVFGAGSSAFSIGLASRNTARATTQRGGRGISIIFCRSAREWPPLSTMPPCRSTRRPASSRFCGGRKPSSPAPSNSASSNATRTSETLGMRWARV